MRADGVLPKQSAFLRAVLADVLWAFGRLQPLFEQPNVVPCTA
jgi:hypothetical protein